jgi:hypothetical protein
MNKKIISTIVAGTIFSSVLGGLIALKDSDIVPSIATPVQIAQANKNATASSGIRILKEKTTNTRAS